MEERKIIALAFLIGCLAKGDNIGVAITKSFRGAEEFTMAYNKKMGNGKA